MFDKKKIKDNFYDPLNLIKFFTMTRAFHNEVGSI